MCWLQNLTTVSGPLRWENHLVEWEWEVFLGPLQITPNFETQNTGWISLIFYTVSLKILVREWWEQNGKYIHSSRLWRHHLESRFWKIGPEKQGSKNKTSPKEPYPITSIYGWLFFSTLHCPTQNLRFHRCMNKWASFLFFLPSLVSLRNHVIDWMFVSPQNSYLDILAPTPSVWLYLD